MPLSTILAFERDHPCSTRICDSLTGKLLYIVSTTVIQQPQPKTVTEVRRAAGGVIATFEWKGFKSDLVSFGNGEPIPTSNWLKKSSLPFKDSVTYKDEDWKAYKWKGFAPGLSLELYSDNDKSKPLLTFSRSRFTPSPTTRHRFAATLTIDDALTTDLDVLDHIVVSFLYLEKCRRQRDDDEFSLTGSS